MFIKISEFGKYQKKKATKNRQARLFAKRNRPYRRIINATEIFADPFTLKAELKAVVISKLIRKTYFASDLQCKLQIDKFAVVEEDCRSF